MYFRMSLLCSVCGCFDKTYEGRSRRPFGLTWWNHESKCVCTEDAVISLGRTYVWSVFDFTLLHIKLSILFLFQKCSLKIHFKIEFKHVLCYSEKLSLIDFPSVICRFEEYFFGEECKSVRCSFRHVIRGPVSWLEQKCVRVCVSTRHVLAWLRAKCNVGSVGAYKKLGRKVRFIALVCQMHCRSVTAKENFR